MIKTRLILFVWALFSVAGVQAEAQVGGFYRTQRAVSQRNVSRQAQSGQSSYSASGVNPTIATISEFGYTFPLGDFDNAGHLSFHESTLMMVTSNFGLGMGVGVNLFVNADLYNVPLYGMLRLEYPKKNLTVYVDGKVGYSLGDIRGFYLSPSLGVRFGYSTAVSLSVGYEMQRFSEVDELGAVHRYTIHGLSLRLGFEL